MQTRVISFLDIPEPIPPKKRDATKTYCTVPLGISFKHKYIALERPNNTIVTHIGIRIDLIFFPQ